MGLGRYDGSNNRLSRKLLTILQVRLRSAVFFKILLTAIYLKVVYDVWSLMLKVTSY